MEERIKYLFRQYIDNKCTRSEFEEFFALMHRSAHDEQLRMLIKEAYEETGQTSLTYVDEFGNLILPSPAWFSENPPEAPLPRKRRGYLLLATLSLMAAAFLLWRMNGSKLPASTDFRPLTKKTTERSESRYVLLPDSTQVWLNGASDLEYPAQFDPKKREVFLSGEAYFDVKHADRIPFIIHTGKISTTVLGTAFNIKAYPGLQNVVVSVSRGKVRVKYEEKEVAVLTRGQQVKVNNSDKGQAEKKIMQNDAAAWQQGQINYDDESLQDIITDLQRIYDVTIVLKNTDQASLGISTSFKKDMPVDQVLQILCRLTDMKMIHSNGIYTIFPIQQ